MKCLLFTMIIVNAMLISTLTSCSKDDGLPPYHAGGITSQLPVTLNLTVYQWQYKGNGVHVNVFSNVIPANRNHSVKVYLVFDGKDTLINQPITFMDGQLWATNSQTDLTINYRGGQPVQYMNIKVVLE